MANQLPLPEDPDDPHDPEREEPDCYARDGNGPVSPGHLERTPRFRWRHRRIPVRAAVAATYRRAVLFPYLRNARFDGGPL